MNEGHVDQEIATSAVAHLLVSYCADLQIDIYYSLQRCCMLYVYRSSAHSAHIAYWLNKVQHLCLEHFYRAAWNADAMRILSVSPSVCPSICPSVKRVHCDKTKERYV